MTEAAGELEREKRALAVSDKVALCAADADAPRERDGESDVEDVTLKQVESKTEALAGGERDVHELNDGAKLIEGDTVGEQEAVSVGVGVGDPEGVCEGESLVVGL